MDLLSTHRPAIRERQKTLPSRRDRLGGQIDCAADSDDAGRIVVGLPARLGPRNATISLDTDRELRTTTGHEDASVLPALRPMFRNPCACPVTTSMRALEKHLHEGRVVLGVVEPGNDPLGEEVSHRPFNELVSRGIFERALNDALAEVPYDLFDRLRDLVGAARRTPRAGLGPLREVPVRIALLFALRLLRSRGRSLVGLGSYLVEELVDGLLGLSGDSWSRV